MSNIPIDTYEYTYNDIYESYIVCSKAGIKKHICYDYNEALQYINEYEGGHVGNIYRDNIGMYIIGIPYMSKCVAEYKTIYTHI